MKLIEKIFGTHSSRELKRIMPLVQKIEDLRPSMQALTDEQLKDKTREFKERLANGETLDDLLPEAFATVREAARRVLGMEHYRVQIIGGIILHHGELEYGSPKKPALVEALCLSFADNLDAKMETMKELLNGIPENNLEWQGYNRLLETNYRKTSSGK